MGDIEGTAMQMVRVCGPSSCSTGRGAEAMGQDQRLIRSCKILEISGKIQKQRVHMSHFTCPQVAGEVCEGLQWTLRINLAIEVFLVKEFASALVDHQQHAGLGCGGILFRSAQEREGAGRGGRDTGDCGAGTEQELPAAGTSCVHIGGH